MQHLIRSNLRWSRPTLAGLMTAIVVMLSLLASHEKLHLLLHQDADAPHHLPCAACSFAQGQIDIPTAAVSEVVAILSVSWTLPAPQVAPVPDADVSIASSRGPPSFASSL